MRNSSLTIGNEVEEGKGVLRGVNLSVMDPRGPSLGT